MFVSKPYAGPDVKECDSVITLEPSAQETRTSATTPTQSNDVEFKSSDPEVENPEQDDTKDGSKMDVENSFPPEDRSIGNIGKGTGPRTAAGKHVSSVNATKHGIFAQATVLKSESRAEYEALLYSLQDHYQPEGGLEHVLVEKIASTLWRYRRMLLAERGDLETRAIPRELTPPTGLQSVIAEIARRTVPSRTGLIEEITDPIILHRCLFLLYVLRSGIEDHGFQIERDQKILTEIYGRPDEYRISKTLYDTYTGWANKSNVSRKKRDSKAVCENVLRAIDDEISRLEQLRDTRAALETERMGFEKMRRNVPEGEQLLRYEVTLDRALERTLNQLERVQRMRKGQFLPPPINVQLS